MPRLIPKSSHNPEQFSLRFRMLMAYHKLTLEDIAKYTHNAISTVGTWKNGRLPNSQPTLEKIAQLFQVTPEYLLTGILQEADAGNAGIAKMQEVSAQVVNYNNNMRYMMPMPGMYYPQMPQMMQGMPMMPMHPHPQMHHQSMNPLEPMRNQNVNTNMNDSLAQS